MKNLITAIACLIILLSFVVVYGQEQINQANMMYVEKTIHSIKEEAKQDGYFSDSLVNELKSDIANQLGVESSEILVTAPGIHDRKKRGEVMNYSVTVPYKNYIGAGKFWGIDDNDNVLNKTYSYSTTSEWIGR